MKNSPKQHLAEACRQMIAGIYLSRGKVISDFRWDKLERETLQLILRNKVMKREDVLRHVAARIVALGIEAAIQSDKNKDFADDVLTPQALAFALQQGKIPDDIRNKILFDEGDSLDTFMHGRVDDLPEKVLLQLLGTTPPAICNEN